MKRITLTAAMLAFLAMTAEAQDQQAGGAALLPNKIGLIDVSYVFKNYKKFEVLKEDLKTKVGKSDGQGKLLVGRIRGLKSELARLAKGSPQYVEKEKQIVSETRKLEDIKRGFLKEEAQIYRTVYLEIADAVKKHAELHGYTLILRFDRNGLEISSEPRETLQKINRMIVYSRSQDDITDSIVKSLNDKYQRLTHTRRPTSDVPVQS